MNFTFKPRLDIESAVPRWLLEVMHEKALQVLEQIGIRVTNKRILARISETKRFDMRHGWVRIRRDLVEDLLAKVRQRPRMDRVMDEEEIILSLGYPGCSHVVDLESDRLEPLTKSRAIEATKLIDSLCDWGVRGGAPGALWMCLQRSAESLSA